MNLTKFFLTALIAASSQVIDKLFQDCEVGICSGDGVDLDCSGKAWPRYCYKCPEGEDQVIFLREYEPDGWKYLTGKHLEFEGRFLLSVVPCGQNEVDSMGNVWTVWCYQDKAVKFEKMGGRIWVYKQDFNGGYPELQFRRLLVDNELLQIVKKGSEGLETKEKNENEEKDKKEGREMSGENKESSLKEEPKDRKKLKNDSKNKEQKDTEKSRDSKDKSDTKNNQNLKDLKSEERKEEEMRDNEKKIRENQLKSEHSNGGGKDNDGESPEKVPGSPSEVSGSSFPDSNTESFVVSDKVSFSISQSINETLSSESNLTASLNMTQIITHSKPKGLVEKSRTVTLEVVPETPSTLSHIQPEQSHEKELCQNLERDRSGRFFFQVFWEGKKLEFLKDRFNNYLLDPQKMVRVPISNVSLIDKQPCKVYNEEGIEIELEKDSEISGMFWEVLYEEGLKIKYLRSVTKKEKERGMYLIDDGTGYRLRSFI